MRGKKEEREKDWAFQNDKIDSVKTCEGQVRNRECLVWTEVR